MHAAIIGFHACLTCFNGAEAKKPRKLVRIGTQSDAIIRSFNGAEAKKPRKLTLLHHVQTDWSELQWGRGKKASEMVSVVGSRVDISLASMGPRQKSLGNVSSIIVIPYCVIASMGPRQKSLGNSYRNIRQWRQIKLQWGRGKKASEIPLLRDNKFLGGRLQWGRGKKASEISVLD